ncbi:MAG: chorismate synthase [Stecheria intestinalis]|jgi:chorismate synthase|uniref:chorismate synthase n=1 Tax=Stecheria intestinalis TaxID=2606630 RepID=UPI0023F255D2|nr:chorismate synthase [Stecheria intestinalis]MDD5881477.1 chorismate synthase [Stecheria intestinalis]MDD7679544.1 chorismate synthase [Stecheria intestinalis]MDY4680423.1 chorismate synthase [Lachnospiraceae bacterium]
MKNTFGNEVTVTLFGESHGPAIGCVIDGLPSGFRIDEEQLKQDMDKRRAVGAISTGRHEADEVQFLSGVKDGVTEGTPLAILIANTNVRSKDYSSLENLARPGHADYTAEMRYHGFQDTRGGGHFSGRLTAPIVAAGSILRQMLAGHGILIATHIASLHGIEDDSFSEGSLKEQMELLNGRAFAVLNEATGEKMQQEIRKAAESLDSVGGILETVVLGMEAGIGEPEFCSAESDLSAAMFSIPAVKGVEFGEGFRFAELYGSQANDAFEIREGKVVTKTNHNGGINGGITNGMPIRFRTVIKPTPSIARKQETVNFRTMENTEIEIHGRHDPAIIHRARAVVDAMTAITLADMLASAHGRQWLKGEE